jgi:hypothetical protein
VSRRNGESTYSVIPPAARRSSEFDALCALEDIYPLAQGAQLWLPRFRADILNLEDYDMHRTHGYIASLLLATALVAPVSILAAPVPQEARVQVRVYDRQHKDYHNWDDNENRSWNRYLADNHKNSHEFSKANKKEQGQYWNYRHAHPDNN